jgi:transposase
VGRGRADDDDTTVNALARRLGVDWHTLWDALKVEAQRRADDPDRLRGVESLGVDEHIWRPGKFGAGREVTCMVDLTRDANGQVRARLLDLVLGRSGPAYAGWLDARRPEFRAQIKSAALDPLRQRPARQLVRRGAGARRLPRRQARHPSR